MGFVGKRKIRKILYGIVLLVVAGGAVLYLCRGSIVRSLFWSYSHKLYDRFGAELTVGDISVDGINTVELSNLTLRQTACSSKVEDDGHLMDSSVTVKDSSLLCVDNLKVKIKFKDLLRRRITVKGLYIDGARLSFVKSDSLSNYDFLFSSNVKESTRAAVDDISKRNSEGRTTYPKILNRLLGGVRGLFPAEGLINNVSVEYRKDNSFITMQLPRMQITRHKGVGVMEIDENNVRQHWVFAVRYFTADRRLEFALDAAGKPVELPYITGKTGARISFDRLTFSMAEETQAQDSLTLFGKSVMDGLTVSHKSISPRPVTFDNIIADYVVNIGKRGIEMDSVSTFVVNDFKVSPYVRLQRGDSKAFGSLPPLHLTVKVNEGWFKAESLFSSLPNGLFANLQNMKVSGDLKYRLLFDADLTMPDSVKFSSCMERRNFKILSYGVENLGVMNSEFEYDAYDDDVLVRRFAVGASNPWFTPLDAVPNLLRQCVLQSEDGEFMWHDGFGNGSIEEALRYDIKNGKFARGGSTISMQLVKNVFLNRHKNIARKIEEAMIVWLIESNRITSKERMLEVYFNIIEWAPLVYGVKEAAWFYFKKRPHELTIDESIFMAFIIPKPKRYERYILPDNRLDSEPTAYYFERMAGILARKGLITEEAAAQVSPSNVCFNI